MPIFFNSIPNKFMIFGICQSVVLFKFFFFVTEVKLFFINIYFQIQYYILLQALVNICLKTSSRRDALLVIPLTL
jgi:hypothetical protein